MKKGLKIACVEYEETQKRRYRFGVEALTSVNRKSNASFLTPYNRPYIIVLDVEVTTTLSLIFSFHPFIVSLLPLTHSSCSCSEMVRGFRVLSLSAVYLLFSH